MPKKYVVFFKTIGRSWFLILILVIVILAIYNLIAAIWLAGITLVLYLLSYIPRIFFKNKLSKSLSKYHRIECENVAKDLGKPINKIREEMFELSKNQGKKKWLIVFLNKQYIYYHQEAVQIFKEVYNKGFSEKEILDRLKDYQITTRSEIKSITECLIKLGRLSQREISVKDHQEQQRFR
ncbi:hypothetical protein LCGC14_0586700 [marine sediment metagenome]|uniref:Uncharacterized protein n=1 Tax=marine sediment metagenome TaxID=412755 RepID=A0A0F9RJR1_9ZZZZ